MLFNRVNRSLVENTGKGSFCFMLCLVSLSGDLRMSLQIDSKVLLLTKSMKEEIEILRSGIGFVIVL